MTKNKVLTLIICIFGLLSRSAAQPASLEKYVIITFEDIYKISEHGVKSYYWIIPIDSIKSNNNLSYLFLSDFSKNDLIDCCAGKDMDPLVVFNNTKYIPLDSPYYSDLSKLRQLINKRRTKLQTITKQWKSGQKEIITIFATAVSGKFCSSNFHLLGQQRYGYKGKVYIPYSSFTYDDEFWRSDEAKLYLHEDFSKIKFDIISY